MTTEWSQDFRYSYYRDIVKAACSRFEIHLIRDARSLDLRTGEHLFLRHDVDCSLEAALRIGLLEHEIGARSSFYIMMQSSVYDPARSDIPKQLVELGHEVGVHFDCPSDKRSSQGDLSSLESMIKDDCSRLEDVLGRAVESFSFHRPVEYLMLGDLVVAGRVNAFSKPLMNWYISDSSGRWRVGEPIQEIARRRHNVLQILTHPIWWDEIHLNANDRLENLFRQSTSGMSAHDAEDFAARLAATLPRVKWRKLHGADRTV